LIGGSVDMCMPNRVMVSAEKVKTKLSRCHYVDGGWGYQGRD
jgi:hypothetical protein